MSVRYGIIRYNDIIHALLKQVGEQLFAPILFVFVRVVGYYICDIVKDPEVAGEL